MKLKVGTLYLFTSICFAILGIINIIGKKYMMGLVVICLSAVYLTLSIMYYKKSDNPKKISVLDGDLEKMNNELIILLDEDKKIKAIKKCRMVTGLGLKEAMEYVDLLNKK